MSDYDVSGTMELLKHLQSELKFLLTTEQA